MTSTSKHRRSRSKRAERWLDKARQYLRGSTTGTDSSASQGTMLPSGSLFSTLYAGSHPSGPPHTKQVTPEPSRHPTVPPPRTHDNTDRIAMHQDSNLSTADRTGLIVQDDWLLTQGMFVEARHHHHPTQAGVVDDVTPDGAILWLAADGALTRHMIEKSDGYEIWSLPIYAYAATTQPLAAPSTHTEVPNDR